ncbi:hypothetical protein B0H13DRAFT_1859556 [Mycena leptocephala]|nr:hypothetical protein B0H13DRAFT_1859556 [Mycena leptocephala]
MDAKGLATSMLLLQEIAEAQYFKLFTTASRPEKKSGNLERFQNEVQKQRTEREAMVRSSSFKTVRFKRSQRGLQSEELWVEGNPQVIWQEWCYKHNYNLAERELDIGCTASFLPEDQVHIVPLAIFPQGQVLQLR